MVAATSGDKPLVDHLEEAGRPSTANEALGKNFRCSKLTVGIFAFLLGAITGVFVLNGLANGQHQSGASSAAVEVLEAKVSPGSFSGHGNFNLENPDPNLLVWDSKSSSGGAEYWEGWLNVPLLNDPYLTELEVSPRACLRVRVFPASQQPARLGSILSHCGGPGSDHHCVNSFLPFFTLLGDSSVRKHYDLWSISQRGIHQPGYVPHCPFTYPDGQLIQPFPTVQCSEIPELIRKEGVEQVLNRMDGEPDHDTWHNIIEPIMNSHGPPIDASVGLAYRNETYVRWYYRLMKLEHNLCYSADRYKVRSPLSNRTYNIFHYTGTVDLAYDIDLFRQATGGEKMSIRGASYGTLVGGVYATLFPKKTHRLILDGDMAPDPDAIAFATWVGEGMEAVWNGQASACDNSLMQGLPAEDVCPAAPDVTHKFYKMAFDTSDLHRAVKVFRLVTGQLYDADVPFTRETMACISEYYTGKSVIGCYRDRNTLQAQTVFGLEMPASVVALDTAGRLNEEALVEWWRTTLATQPIGVSRGLMWAVAVGSWPVIPRPMPPLGNSDVKPLVIGNLHDAQTPYENAQKMQMAFSGGRLMTWQGYGHCLQMPHDARAVLERYEQELSEGKMPTYTDEVGKLLCAKIAHEYLANGTMPRNGHTCKVAGPVKTGLGPRPWR